MPDFQSYPLLIIPFLLLALYSMDVISILLRRSTQSIRKSHHWAQQLENLDPTSSTNEVSVKSAQYLPGWKFVFGSLPRYLATSAMMYVILNHQDNTGFWIFIAVIPVYCAIDFSLCFLLKSYCMFSHKEQITRSVK